MEDTIRAVSSRVEPARPRLFRAYMLILGLTSLLIFGVLVWLNHGLSLSMLVPLLVLVIVATHLEAIFSDETAVNGSIIVICAALVAFKPEEVVLAAGLCGVAAGIHLMHLRDRVWSKMIVNTAATGLSACIGGVLMATLTTDQSSWDATVLVAPLAVLAYWCSNNLIVASALALFNGEPFWKRSRDLLRAENEMVLVGFAAVICGLVARELGSVVGTLCIAGFLAVVDRSFFSSRTRHLWTRVGLGQRAGYCVIATAAVCVGFVVGELGAVIGGGTVVVAASLGSILVALVRLHDRTGLWDWHLARGLAVIDAPRWIVFGMIGVIAQVTTIWLAGACLVVALVVMHAVARRLDRRQAALAHDDRQIARALESAVLEGRSIPSSTR